MRAVRVLIVDDSATMRRIIATKLSHDPNITVVGEAANPYEAREAIKALNPDVMTLDIEMPNMDGLSFLEKVMRLRPFPVIMVSTLTQRGASETIRALEIGAVDYVAKPSTDFPNTFDELAGKIKIAANIRVTQSAPYQENRKKPAQSSYEPDGKVVAIGASTGGVDALVEILGQFPENCPPTVVTIHMPPLFTKSFAKRLNQVSQANVSEAADRAPLKTGQIYIAPGGVAHLEIVGSDRSYCRLNQGDPVNGHRPSVDVLFESVAAASKNNAVGVILTGMGSDGANGLLSMRQVGARTLGQNEASCIVYGMPRVAFERHAVEQQLPIKKIASEILALTSNSHKKG